jgi:LmbE family N-acetylglucosaminyl deacetylase
MVSAGRYAHIYLSPHLDDATLSCGGRIWQQVRAGERVAVFSVFAGTPEPGVPLSDYAQELHARWHQPEDAIEWRREEDVQALAVLGAEPVHWRFLDCVYRRSPDGDFLHTSEEALSGEIHSSEAGLVKELAGRIALLPLTPGGTLYVPLGVGRHVDHRIVRQAADRSGRRLVYFEDFPYAGEQGALEEALATGCWGSELVTLSAEALDAKVAAIACYRSQISTFWVDRPAMAISVREFAAHTGKGKPAERYWRLTRP